MKNKNEEADSTDNSKKTIAESAYRVLDSWGKPPGVTLDGSFEAAAFNSWVDKMKIITQASGHYEVAMILIGHVLIYSPPDPSGLWIHEAIATVMNAADAKEIRDGFRTASFNSRGVFYFTKGDDELELSKAYDEKAEAVKAKGYSRLATALRELADSYKKDAGREANRDPFYDND